MQCATPAYISAHIPHPVEDLSGVLAVQTLSGRREFGLVVDSVSDVVDIDAAELKETPSFGSKAGIDLIKGLAAIADRMVILLNVDELIRRDLAQAETPMMAGAA